MPCLARRPASRRLWPCPPRPWYVPDLATRGFPVERPYRPERTDGRLGGLRPGLSAGVAQRKAAESQDEVLIRADRALYQAKHSGKNRVVAE